jgi:hypothetical protein
MSDIVSVKDFGAKGDSINVAATATISSGSNALTATGAAFTGADVGKLILVPGAGTAGAVLKTTIAAFTNATHITLAANASTALTAAATNILYGTDDHSAITAAQAAAVSAGNGLFWPSGNYLTSLTLFLGNDHTRHVNFGGVTITFTGSGTAISFDAGATSGVLWDISFGSRECPFRIVGNADATIGVFVRSVHHSSINIIVRDFTGYGLIVNFSILSRYFVKMSANDGGGFSVHPSCCLLADRRQASPNETNVCCDFEIIAEGIYGTGVQVGNSIQCRFTGTSEGNIGGGGVYEGTGCNNNTWDRFHSEANGGPDWLLYQSSQTLMLGCTAGISTTGVLLQSVAFARIIGGQYSNISTDAASGSCHFENVNYGSTWTMNSSTCTWTGVFSNMGVYLPDNYRQGSIPSANLAAALTGPTITAPTYANSWVDFGGIRVGYYKTAANVVHLCGTIKNGTVGSKAFTLPAGFRPSATLFFPATNPYVGTISFMIEVDANGDVIPQSGVNSSCALDSVAFLAEQ